MMIVEIGSLLSKYGWATIIPYLVWSYKRDQIKLQNTFTRKETTDMIDLKLKPLQQSIEANNNMLLLRFDALLTMYKDDKKDTDARRDQAAKMNKEMQVEITSISKDTAVMRTKLDHLDNK